MLILPELAVALRHELRETFARCERQTVTLSVWAKARHDRAEGYVGRLRRSLAEPLDFVLWQKGLWAAATAARSTIGGELTTREDVAIEPQIWLFDAALISPTVKKRFGLASDARFVGRVALPLEPPTGGDAPGVALGYLFRSAPTSEAREGMPFLRMLPDLYPGEFLDDPHVNFVAALRYAREHARDVSPFGRTGAGRILTVGPSDLRP